MMNLVLIHGRAQQNKNEVDLRNAWIDSWKHGLAKSGLSIPEGLNIIFPYYGDLLDNLHRRIHGAESMTGIIARGNKVATEELTAYYEILLEIATSAGLSLADIQRNYKGEFKEKGVLNIEWIQAIFETLEGIEAIGNLSIRTFTADVAFYLKNSAVKRQINDFIATGFNENPTVVVGHSLGSVIGYNVLKDRPQLTIKKYITLGSPLGIKAIRNKLDPPIGMPECIKNGWYNAYDERDFVALRPLDSKHFNIQPSIHNTNHVDNPSDNRHDITGYLSDADVAKVLYDAIK